MNKNCVYYCEGEDDLQLVDALKVSPSRILPGKAKNEVGSLQETSWFSALFYIKS